MKILINGPGLDLKNKGGVANHIWGLKNYWTNHVRYNTVGNRSSKHSGRGKWWLIWDIPKFITKLLIWRPDYVWINPSISSNALKRDFIFMYLAKVLGVKTAVFIHGFDKKNFENIDKNWLATNLNNAAFIMVLAQSFKCSLRLIGVTVPIELTSTKVEDSLMEGFHIESKNYLDCNTLLFLARVEKAKGIYETIDIFEQLKEKLPYLRLQISGDGSELEATKKYVYDRGIEDVHFTGVLKGKEVQEAYIHSLLLLLITSHGEGMPTNVLEAMAFGLPVVTRPVGGLSDFFEDGKMGVLSESISPKIFAEKLLPILTDRSTIREMGLYNHKYAKDHFLASKVAQQLELFFNKHNI